MCTIIQIPHFSCTETLIVKGANVNHASKSRSTPLMWAVLQNQVGACRCAHSFIVLSVDLKWDLWLVVSVCYNLISACILLCWLCCLIQQTIVDVLCHSNADCNAVDNVCQFLLYYLTLLYYFPCFEIVTTRKVIRRCIMLRFWDSTLLLNACVCLGHGLIYATKKIKLPYKWLKMTIHVTYS